MELWGITGLMGSGKSSAMQYLESKGHATVDADQVAREVVDATTADGRRGVELLVNAFGRGILADDGVSLDRRKLRDVITGNPLERDRLERILHPLILASLRAKAALWEKAGIRLAFVEGSRLLESGYAEELDGLILVSAAEALRLKRVMARDAVPRSEVEPMFRLQNEAPLRTAATLVWTNESDESALRLQIDAFLRAHGL